MAIYNRYENFIENGYMKMVPYVDIAVKDTDKYVYYEQGKSRLDLISYQFYGNPDFGWLILQANPEVGSYEFKIPNNTLIRVPYPLSTTLSQYNDALKVYDKLYGIK